jgi:hypothetical protein
MWTDGDWDNDNPAVNPLTFTCHFYPTETTLMQHQSFLAENQFISSYENAENCESSVAVRAIYG